MSGNSVPSPRATEPVVRLPGQEVLDFGAIVTAKLVQNISVDLEQITTESNATIDKMNHNNESQKALESWTGTIVDWGTPLSSLADGSRGCECPLPETNWRDFYANLIIRRYLHRI